MVHSLVCSVMKESFVDKSAVPTAVHCTVDSNVTVPTDDYLSESVYFTAQATKDTLNWPIKLIALDH